MMLIAYKTLVLLAGSILIGTAAHCMAQQRAGGDELASRATSQPADVSPDVDLARQILAAFDYGEELSHEEAQQILRLSTASRPTKIEVFRLALADAKTAERVGRHAAFLAKAAVGLDASGNFTRAIYNDCLHPVFTQAASPPESLVTACLLLRCLPMKDVSAAADTITDRMIIEQDRPALVTLSETLTWLARDLGTEDSKRLSRKLVQVMQTKRKDYELWFLGEPLKVLVTNLRSEDVQPLTAAIYERMKTEQDDQCLIHLGNALEALAPKLSADDARVLSPMLLEWLKRNPDTFIAAGLDTLAQVALRLEPDEIQPIAVVFVERLKVERESFELNSYGESLKLLAPKLKPADISLLAAPLIERIKADQDISVQSILGESLGPLAARLDSEDVRSVACLFVEQMKTAPDSYNLEQLANAFVSLSSALKPADAKPLATTIVELMTTRRKGHYQLHRSLESLVQQLEPTDACPLAAALTAAMKADDEYSSASTDLGQSLGLLAPILDSGDLQPAAAILVERMSTERSDRVEAWQQASWRENVCKALRSFAPRLEARDSRPLVNKLIERMQAVPDGNHIADLGIAVGAFSESLEASDLRLATAAIVDQIRIEQQNPVLDKLVGALVVLARKAGPDDSRSVAVALVERMKNERDGNEIVALGWALAQLADKLDTADFRPGLLALVDAMKSEQDGEVLVKLGETLAALRRALSQEELAQVAERLTERLALARFGELARYRNRDETTPGLNSVLESASAQSLVNALKAPLLVDDLVIHAIAGALMTKLGGALDCDMTFVEWAMTDPKAVALGLDLEGPGPWSALEQARELQFPILQNVEISPLGSFETPSAVRSLWVDKNLAYLPAGIHGLQIIDMTDPRSPKQLGLVPAGPYAIAVCAAEKYAYVVAGPAGWPDAQLHVIDVSNANDPKVVGSYHLPDYPSSVAVRKDHVYVADRTKGLRVIDVSNPKAPKEVGSFTPPSVIVDAALAGDYALLADEEIGLRIVDISSPELPKEVSVIRTEGPCIDVCVQRNRAFAATGEGGIIVIDISNPRLPKHIATISTGFAVSVSTFENLAVVGVAKRGFLVLDVTDPAAPAARELKMSANGVGAFFHGERLFLTDVSIGGGPYGIGDRTVLRIYDVKR